MQTFYVKVTPLKIGQTGYEPLGAYLARMRQKSVTQCNFNGAITTPKGQEFGVLTGSGDDLSEILEITETTFAIKRVTKEEFIGACYKYYTPVTGPGIPSITLAQFLIPFGIDIQQFNTVECVKAYKRNLFKEVSKKLFPDDNDSLSNLARAVLAISQNGYYSSLTTDEKTLVDQYISRVKAIYNKSVAISGLGELVDDLETCLVPYYTAVVQLESKTTEADALTVNFG